MIGYVILIFKLIIKDDLLFKITFLLVGLIYFTLCGTNAAIYLLYMKKALKPLTKELRYDMTSRVALSNPLMNGIQDVAATDTTAQRTNTISTNHSSTSLATSRAASALEELHFYGEFYYSSQNEVEIHKKIESYFIEHIDGENTMEIGRLINDRVHQLHLMNETPDSIDSIFNKAYVLDRVALETRGAIRSIPFAVAGIAYDKIPILNMFAKTAAEIGLNSGIQSSIADTVGVSLLEKATFYQPWLSAKNEELEPVMRNVLEKVSPSLLRTAFEAGVASQAYSGRNILRLPVAATVSHFLGPTTASSIDTYISGIGGVLAGIAAAKISHHYDINKGRVGPEFLLSREDWKYRYLSLKNTSLIKDSAKSFLKRAAKFPLDVATDSLGSLNKVLTAPSVGKTLLLGGGFSGVTAVRSIITNVMNSAHYSAASSVAISHAANIVLSAPLFFALPGVEMSAGIVEKRVHSLIQESIPSSLESMTNWTANLIQTSLNRR